MVLKMDGVFVLIHSVILIHLTYPANYRFRPVAQNCIINAKKMPNSDFVKGECRHCTGHIEFPAETAGQTIVCPHCGEFTELVPPELPGKTKGSSNIWPGIALVVCLVAGALAGGYLYWQKAGKSGGLAAQPPPTVQSSTPTSAPIAVAPAKSQPPQVVTNDFGIMPFKLEKTPGSSLVYVIGTLKNMTDHQRFGVKIAFGLFDDNQNPVGSATDYQSVLEPNGEWRFKALVMESKAVSAKFNSIAEDK